MPTFEQKYPDSEWTYAKPVPPKGLARLESWLRKRGFKRLAACLGRFDERGLGR